MRSISDWLEDKLAEEPKETPKAPTVQRLFPYVSGLAIGLVLPRLVYDWHWRPVWAFLLIMAVSVVASYFVYGRVGPWWALALSLVGGVLFTTLVW
jgi:hypothetical protein